VPEDGRESHTSMPHREIGVAHSDGSDAHEDLVIAGVF
jgi:hypothetical protein